jgi:hypothetical protein
MVIQQGDVVLTRIDSIPQGKKVERKERGYVLAEGESSGHAHTIEEEIEMVEKDGVLYIGCKGDTVIKHEEHKHVTLPAGNYQISIVREYDHFLEEARKVQD